MEDSFGADGATDLPFEEWDTLSGSTDGDAGEATDATEDTALGTDTTETPIRAETGLGEFAVDSRPGIESERGISLETHDDSARGTQQIDEEWEEIPFETWESPAESGSRSTDSPFRVWYDIDSHLSRIPTASNLGVSYPWPEASMRLSRYSERIPSVP